MFRNVFNRGARQTNRAAAISAPAHAGLADAAHTAEVRRRNAARAVRRAAFEALENRQMFTVFGDVASSVDLALTQVDNALGSIDAAQNKLPLVNKRLVDMPAVRDSVKSFKNTLVAPLQALDDAATNPDQLKQAIYNALSNVPGVGNLVGDTNGNGPGVDDITVHSGYDPLNGKVKVTLDLVKQVPLAGESFDFGTGLDALPLKIEASGDVSLAVGFKWDDFTFGWENGAPVFDVSAADDFKIQLEGSIENDPVTNEPTQLSGVLGFLKLTATDAHHDGPELSGELTLDVTKGNNGYGVTPKLNAAAHVDLNLKAEFNASGSVSMPSIETDFYLDWDFVNTDPRSGAINFGSAPDAGFTDVRLNLGSFIDQMAGPIIDAIQEVTEPMQPIIDVLTTELPVLTEVAEFFGSGEPVTLLTLAGMAADSDQLPPDVRTYISLAKEVVEIVDAINAIQQSSGGGQNLIEAPDVHSYFVNFGDFDLGSGADLPNGDLRQAAASALMATDFTDPAQVANLMEQQNWSELMPANFDISKTLDTIKADIENELGDVVGGLVNGVIDHFAEPLQGNKTYLDLTFPLFESPADGIFKLLLGHDVDLVALDAGLDIHAGGGETFNLYGFDVSFEANVNATGSTHLAYDTYGLRKFITAAFDSDPSTDPDPLHIADGFYASSGTFLDVTGGISAKLALDYAVFEIWCEGGIDAGLHLGLDLSHNTLDGDPSKVRLFTELGDYIFQASGIVSGHLDFGVQVGVEILGEFIGWSETFNIAEGTILEFDTGGTNIINPFKKPDPVGLASIDPATGLLTLNVGTRAPNHRFVEGGVTNEKYTINHVSGQAGDETVVVTAFGVSEKFTGVTQIVGDFGTGDDTLLVNKDVLSPLAIHGGNGNDSLEQHGSGDAQLWGDENDDVLAGGNGANYLNGGDGNDQLTGGSGGASVGNVLLGGYGDDVLIGRDGDNDMNGGFDDDSLQAGPNGDTMDGGSGDDVFANGAGADHMKGNRGNDTMSWSVGQGADVFEGNEGYDSVSFFGTDAADAFTLTRAGGNVVVQAPGQTLFVLGAPNSPEIGTEELAVAGGKGADTVVVNELTGLAVKTVGVNLGDVIDLDNAQDTVQVYGTAAADVITVEAEAAGLKNGTRLRGGITKVSGLPTYTVRVANVMDDLTVDTLASADDVDVVGITGPMRLMTGAGDDTVDVMPNGTGKFLGTLDVNAGAGSNALRVIENTSSDEVATLTSSNVTSKLLPFGVNYSATGGTFGGGVQLTTGGGSDGVVVQSTLPGVATLVRTLGGNDAVTVSSDGTATGNLSQIRGPLTVDGGAGSNLLTLVDKGAASGNGGVAVNGSQVLNFAGMADDTPVTFQSLGGSMIVQLEGSDAASVAESFRLDNPSQPVWVKANGGNDTVLVRGLVKPANVELGAGNDSVTVAGVANTLDTLTAALTVLGGDGVDGITAVDQGAAAGKGYTLTATSMTRGGAAAINYQVEDLTVLGTNFGDNFLVAATPTTAVSFHGNAGADSVIGPNASNLWEITEQDGGRLNGSVRFSSAANLTGGTSEDRFVFSDGKGVSGNVIGDSGTDTLDYSPYGTAVTVDLPNFKATGVGGLAQLVENVNGGWGNDLVQGNGGANVLKGGPGDDILVGGDGADQLLGHAGRDLLIGGLSADNLQGGTDDDLLIDGVTVHDADKTALKALMKEWTRTDAGYLARISHLRNGGAGALNGSYKLNAGTVFSDASVDTLSGQTGEDWYWAKQVNPADTLLQKTSTEVLN